MSNLWKRFSGILPQRPVTVGRITGHNSDGTSNILLPGGANISVTGQDVPTGRLAFIQDGAIQNEAPSNLIEYEIEI